MGLSPFDAPATFSMMQYTELAHGVWYPKGGMYRIVEALVEIARLAGVEITLTGTDGLGNAVNSTSTTDANGEYRVGGLLAGTYDVAG